MTNRYPGRCGGCHTEVPAGAGTWERDTGVRHLPGQCPAKPAAAPARKTPAACGLYRRGERLFVVREFTPQGEDRKVRFARELVATTGHQADRAGEDGEAKKLRSVKAPGMQWELTPAEAVPLDEAKRLGIRFGECLLCGTPIEAKESVDDRGGIGPVCWRKQTELLALAG